MNNPKLITLSHSGGVQSQCLLEMVLRGDLKPSTELIVLNANPGMEDPRTLDFIEDAKIRCLKMGIEYITADGPDLYQDMLLLKFRRWSRLDNPPYWTSENGKRGKLVQKCTFKYKIQPMRSALRDARRKRGIKLQPAAIETWIGFASDEWHRCSDSDVKYIKLKYPLIDLGMDRAMVTGYFLKHGIPMPPRSVCAACFSNGLKYYSEMKKTHPSHFEKACKIDDSVRDWSQIGVKNPVFISSTLRPLRELSKENFGMDDEDMTEHHCNSGVCFL